LDILSKTVKLQLNMLTILNSYRISWEVRYKAEVTALSLLKSRAIHSWIGSLHLRVQKSLKFPIGASPAWS